MALGVRGHWSLRLYLQMCDCRGESSNRTVVLNSGACCLYDRRRTQGDVHWKPHSDASERGDTFGTSGETLR